MSVKFFGQFLVERGEIDGAQLCQALDRMSRTNLPLGQLACREGLLSQADAERLNGLQRSTDRPFGRLAVEEGLLDEAQVERLLDRQREMCLRLGEALVALGHLGGDRLGGLLDDFKNDQAEYAEGTVSLPDELAELRSAQIVLDYLPKFALRVARLHWKFGDAVSERRVEAFHHRVGVSIGGDAALDVVLAVDTELAEALAAATCHVARADLDADLVDDGLGEFLNVVAGNVLAALERDDVTATLQPPNFSPETGGGHEIELASSMGSGRLLLRRPA